MPEVAPAVPVDEEQALDRAEGGEAVGVPGVRGVVRGVTKAVARPVVVREALGLGRDLTRVLVGAHDIAPSPKDKRFADPAWRDNPGYRRLGQGYLLLGEALTRLVDDLEARGADWHDVERARFAMNVLVSALAPTNTVLGNPAALKRAFDTAGASLVRGARNFVADVRHNGGMPAQTDRSAFTVGEDLAVTPGAVVHRDAFAEVIQYAPSTPTVRARPLLVVPPPIGRFYFLDLRPGRSFVEYAASRGMQVFLLSWRNPTAEQAGWSLDDYARRVLSALDVVTEVAEAPAADVLGFCAGGIITSTVLSHLAVTGDPRVASAAFAVTLLDFDSRAPLGAFSSPRLLDLAAGRSRRGGVITAQSLSSVFSWMRPDDLVFPYVVNNWLLGQDPPVFDILAWNADGTNLPACLHAQFLDLFRENLLCRGEVEVLGTRVDLSRIAVPTFVTGAVNDHLTPWTGCYRTTQLLSGPTTFVLSNAGHIASLVNPPGNPKATYWTDGDLGPDPQAWLATATRRTGSWWEAWVDWELAQSGDQRPAPQRLGNDRLPPLEPAPGSYVRDRVPG